jgi:hypothetical protein
MKRLDAAWLIHGINLVLVLLLFGSTPVVADELADLKKQIEIIAGKIEQLEKQRASQQAPVTNTSGVVSGENEQQSTQAVNTPASASTSPAPRVITTGDMPGSFKIPDTNTSYRIYGLAQMNFIYDLAGRPASRNGDSAGIGTAPLNDSPEYLMRGDTRIGARDSRLGISTFTPTEYGDFRTVFEGDFNTSPAGKRTRATTSRSAFSIRHAYGELGNFLAGQTYTTYMDISAFSEKLDGAGPIGRTFMRQGQLRYTHRINDYSRFAIALENPRGDFIDADDETLDDSLPDLTAHYRYQTDRWHMQFGGMIRRMGIDDGGPTGVYGGVDDTTLGWGLQHSTAILLGDSKDRISWYINLGDGLGRYAESGADQGASITLDGKLDTQYTYGGFISYRHWWTDTLRSNIDFGMMHHDLNPLEDAMFPDIERDSNRRIFSSHSNIIWSPLDRVTFGLEYVWGNRTVHDGRHGKVRRLLFTSVYDF